MVGDLLLKNFMSMLKHSWGYDVLRALVSWVHRLYYREIVVEGKENLPKGEAFMITPNHQNALMDPLAIICNTSLQPVFLTRADIFASPFLKRLFRFLKMLPIYRQRDGGNVVDRNQKIFEEIVAILSHKQPVAVFPEATHWGMRSLKPIKKGTARLAFMAEEANSWKLGLKIVPTSIYFSDYSAGKSKLHVRFGQPFSIAHYKSNYEESKEQAIRKLNMELSERIKAEMLHIADTANHDLIVGVIERYNSRMRKKLGLGQSLGNWFDASKTIADSFNQLNGHEEEFNYLKQSSEDLDNELKRLGLNKCYCKNDIQKKRLVKEQVRLGLLFPLFVLGYTLNYLPLKVPVWIARKVAEDYLFWSSFKMVLSMLLFPLYYFVVFAIGYVATDNVWYALSPIVVGALLANFSVLYLLDLNSFVDKIKFYRLQKAGKLADLKLSKEGILRQVDVLIEKTTSSR